MQRFSNNALSALVAGVDPLATTLLVSSGATFPATTGGDHFLITLVALDQNGNEASWEICKVTFRDGNELTVLRAQEGTIAQSWAAGTRVELRLTAGSMVAPDDPRLSDAREWTGTTVTQAEAEAGTATTVRKWTAQRVFQAITAWWGASAHKTKLDGIQAGAQVNAVTSVAGRTGAVTLGIADIASLQNGLDGKAAASHAHSDATTSVAGFMSAADKTKLNGVATGANNYSHPTGDGNLHVPATGTTNNGKVLKAGSTAGSLSWGTLSYTDVGAAAASHTHNYAGSASAGGAAASVAQTLTRGTGLTGNNFNGSAATTWAVSYGTAAGTACQGNDARLSDSRPASDVYAWAKAAAKPSYTAAEVGAAASSHVGATGAAHGNATTSVAGFMSAADKVKVDNSYIKSNILGTVSQSAGVPTGAIVERGSNANGAYVRYADGTQICTATVTYTNRAGSYVDYLTLPAAFVTTAGAVCMASVMEHKSNAGTPGDTFESYVYSTTVVRVYGTNNAPTARGYVIDYVAIGRWF